MRKGFSLMELLIVITIVSILSLLTVPSLLKTLAKAKRTEAYIYLRSLAQAQKAFFAENGYYTPHIKKDLGWKPEGSFRYTYGIPEDNIMGSLATPPSFLSGASVSKKAFKIYAAGTIYGEKPDILSVDENQEITIVSDSLIE